jgi:hypothetical protein
MRKKHFGRQRTGGFGRRCDIGRRSDEKQVGFLTPNRFSGWPGFGNLEKNTLVVAPFFLTKWLHFDRLLSIAKSNLILWGCLEPYRIELNYQKRYP